MEQGRNHCSNHGDAELQKTPQSGVGGVEWHFFPGKTGIGPTGPLQKALNRAGIKTFMHP